MNQYVIYFFLALLSIAASIGLGVVNQSNPTLIETAEPVLWGCFGLPIALVYVFILYLGYDLIAQLAGKQPDILRRLIAVLLGLLIVPVVIIEATFPSQGWGQAILIAGLIWGSIPISVMFLGFAMSLLVALYRRHQPQD